MISNNIAGCLIGSRLMAGNLERIREHYFGLAPEDRLNRFGGFIGDDGLDNYVDNIDFDRKVLLGLELTETCDLVGLAELWFDDPNTPIAAEIAVSVNGDWRGKGFGLRLVADAVGLAFARGAGRVEFLFEPNNQAIKRIVRELGGRIDPFAGKAVLTAPMPIAA
jgi:GNAT superfamily N-acetyltransferase